MVCSPKRETAGHGPAGLRDNACAAEAQNGGSAVARRVSCRWTRRAPGERLPGTVGRGRITWRSLNPFGCVGVRRGSFKCLFIL